MLLGKAVAGAFAVIVVALAVALAYHAAAGTPRRLDKLLLGCFCVFLFVAWFFEPYVIHLCGWEGLPTKECQRHLIGRLWLFYAETFDPIFLNLPFWLRIVCSLDTLLFGPFYVISVYAFVTKQQEAHWYQLVALPFAGALVYSTIVYFSYEVLAESHRASLVWVFLINLPWTLAPILLVVRCSPRRRTAFDAPFTAQVVESYFGAEAGRYSGELNASGQRHGKGVMLYSESGDVYTGEWLNDRPEGFGRKHFSNGDTYVGGWKGGVEHGLGSFHYTEGDYTYEGNFEAGRYAGHGAMRQAGKLIASGDWTTWTWSEGSWRDPYPRAGGRGTKVTARRSKGSPAPRRRVAVAQ
jgi:hypothetical protein